jgi:histidine triad (HIT) family protein
VFCRIVAGQLPSTRIYEDDRVLAFMDINPITPGHALVIVKAHRENLFEMDEEECVAAMRAAKKVSDAVRATLKPDGLNLFQANGLVAFQTVFHFHIHVLPRYTGDPIQPPIGLLSGRAGDPEEIRKNGERIRSFFDK